jgi:hypothetical protein
MQSIFAKARAKGWIETRAGSGAWPKGQLPSREAPPHKASAATVLEALAEEIARGRWAGGEALPSPKILAQQQGVHVVTLRKVLTQLEKKTLLVRTGRTWSVHQPKPPKPKTNSHRSRSELLCLGAADPEGGLRMGTDREWDFWREIQAEASRCSLRPVIVPWEGKLPSDADDALGAIVSTWHVSDPHPLLGALRHSRVPSAVWVENPLELPGNRYRDASRMWFHDMAYGREAGVVLAKHLQDLGHRHIAWIAPFHGSVWSRNRLAGLVEALGPEVQVHRATCEWVSEWDVQNLVWSDPEVWKTFQLQGIDHRGKVADLVRPIMESRSRDRSLETMEPVLQAALDSGATLWVAASDLVARWCLHWLSARGLEVPRDLALAGFDDSREALRHDLTSVRFDAQAMARSMVRQILSPSQAARKTTRYQGAVVQRGSTG